MEHDGTKDLEETLAALADMEGSTEQIPPASQSISELVFFRI